MKLKFNWGFGLAVTYIIFMIGTLTMVYIFMNQDVSLETDNYYAKGLQYQEQIDKINRAKDLPEQLDISVVPSNIVLAFPKIFNAGDYSGNIFLYRPDSKQKDFSVAVSPDTSNAQSISTSSLEKGLWKVKVDWAAKGTSYYSEKLVMVN
jgi:hypothetical protein